MYGSDVIDELIRELHASVELSQGFEGEMKNLANYARWGWLGRGGGGGGGPIFRPG